MEKASTPRSRLTRSSAKQVNTLKNTDDDHDVKTDENTAEDVKSSNRKSKRKSESKSKSNGDASTNLGSKSPKNPLLEDVSDGVSLDGCESGDSNLSTNNGKSPKVCNENTPPTISRKSLRPRRSMTPGPELESSASKRIKRATSEEKLRCTPTNRRNVRAKSETKDYVFNDRGQESSINFKNYSKESNMWGIEKIDERDEGNDEEISVSLPIMTEVQDKSCEDTLKIVTKPVDKEDEYNREGLENNHVDPNNTVDVQDIERQSTGKYMEVHAPIENEESIQPEKEKSNLQNLSQECCSQDVPHEQNNTPTNNESSNTTINHDNIDSITESNNSLCTEDLQTHNDDQNESEGCEQKESLPDHVFKQIQTPVEIDHPELSVDNCEGIPGNTGIPGAVDVDNNDCQSNVQLNISPVDQSDNEEIHSGLTKECPQTGDCKNIIIENNFDCADQEKEQHDIPKKVKPVAEHASDVELIDQKDNESKFESKSNDESVLICDSDSAENDEGHINADNIENSHLISTDYENTDEKKLGAYNNFGNYNSKDIVERDTSYEIPVEKQALHGLENNDNDNIIGVSGEKYVEVNITEHSTENYIENNKSHSENLGEQITIEEFNDDPITEVLEENCVGNKDKEANSYDIQSNNLDMVVQNEDSGEFKFSSSVNLELQEQDPFKEEQPVDNILIEETQRLEEVKEYEINKDKKEQIAESKDDVECIKDDIPVDTSNINKGNLPNSDEIHEDEHSEDYQRSDKYDGSSSNSDIYKNMSDFGSDDERRDHYDDDDDDDGGISDSEEYGSSPDGEEDEEPEEDMKNSNENLIKDDQENVPSNDQKIEKDIKNIEMNEPKDGDKLFDSNTRLTYDKALAILNQNRVKKIDDEEFFDMFTQELNRVSDQDSGSDSDIAIVDEYLIEPEEPKKPNKKPQVTIKMPQRPPPTPAPQPNQPLPPENFPVAYNSQVFPQHNHPVMQRMNFPHTGMYHQYNQRMIPPPMNSIRDPAMYDQFGPPPSNMPDQRLFDPNLPPQANYTQANMYNHALGSVSDTPMHYTNAPGLKVRNVSSMNNSQCYNQNYVSSNQVASVPTFEMNTNRISADYEDESSVRKSVEAMTETDNKLYDGPLLTHSGDYTAQGSNPILEMLKNMNNEQLKLLTQALKLTKRKGLKTQKKKMFDSLKNPSKTYIKKKSKKEFREKGLKIGKKSKKMLAKQFASLSYKFEDNSEHSSENTNDKQSSSEELDIEQREVTIDDGQMCISVNTNQPTQRKQRHRVPRTENYNDSLEDSNTWSRKRKHAKTQYKYETSSLDSSIASPEDSYMKPRHIRKGKKKTRETTTSLKSASGTFTVDKTGRLTTSESESDLSQDESLMEDMSRSLKSEIDSGKNKMSNIFNLQSNQFHHQKKRGLKRKMKDGTSESEEEFKKMKLKKLRKLPSDILEQLTDGGAKSKRHLVIISEEEGNEPEPSKGKRKQRNRMKVRSAAAEESYIPLVSAGATQFGLSRLDKGGILNAAEKAAKFRTNHLYGNTVKRITIMDF